MTLNAERELKPKKLTQILNELGAERLVQARKQLSEIPVDQRRRQLQVNWSRLLGNVEPRAGFEARQIETSPSLERVVLKLEPSIVVPLLLFKPDSTAAEKRSGKSPVIVAMAQAGKQRLLRAHAKEIAALLASGFTVCLPDVRGTGETSAGDARGRRGAATSFSSGELMLGGTMLGAQLRDLRAVLAWLRTRDDLDSRQLSLWGESLASPNPSGTDFQIPRDDDGALPRSPEPLGGLLALLAALYEDDVQAVYLHRGLASFESVLPNHLVLIPHDAVVPSALTAGDLCDLVAALARQRVRLEAMVDGWNRTLTEQDLARTYQTTALSYRVTNEAPRFSFGSQQTSCVQWLSGERTARSP